MTTLNSSHLRAWLAGLSPLFEANLERLSQLDAALGDGDHGASMVRGMRAVSAKIAAMPAAGDCGSLLQAAGMAIVSATGGATGPLFGAIFMEAGKVARGKSELASADLAAMFQAASSALSARGGALPGDKTMVDALAPAAAALAECSVRGDEVAQALAMAAQAAEQGAAATAAMPASKGRARYLGQRALGHVDAGATSVALIMQALANTALDIPYPPMV